MSQNSYASGAVVISAAAMTGTTTVYSAWTDMRAKHVISYEHVWTGTPNGSFGYQVTNSDPRAPGFAGGSTPSASAFASLSPVGAAGRATQVIDRPGTGWVRCSYTNTSGTGTLTTTVFAQE